ncbi:immunoglobulin lambda-1 light chain-like isoform X2 [Silurus meridionalis]|nr:immunoglobulin lambda-1 light chain-like isoform X2 [Silurus meridionalis]
MMFLSTAALAGLLLSLSGFEAIVHLTQEKIMNVNVGQDVKILCRRDDSHSWSISWYQQKAGETPKFVLADATRASGLSSRFTYTDNGLDEYLNIARVEAEDEAVYYCGCIICDNHHSAAVQRDTPRGSSPPSLLLLAPSGSLLSESDVSVMCVAQGFYPEGVTMSWSEDSSSVTGDKVQTGPYQRQADGTFSQTSVLKLSKQRWSSGRTYTCRLSHSALSTPLSQSTSLDQCM